ncbi:maelstrom homolog [Pelobates cultripes]|uniref:Protein maelstrom homolog n=2 Tax=Pelobates cultripes TaxID=61616 RepID=A0AAD1VL02_PELCU|nr:maelstrom homolog [Pelobates cultripes]
MPNKKAARNAYFFFALDMIPELRRRGLEVSGVRDAIPLCSEYWALLSSEEKEKYADKARGFKNNPPKESRPNINCVNLGQQAPGKTVILRPEDSSPDTNMNHKGLDQSVFYFLNIFSHGEMPSLCEQRFVPCEIGCVRYSLRDGIMGTFHEFIDPGELPRGFRYHCQLGSSSTHQIPVSGFELANSDYHNLFRNLCEFVCPAFAMVPTVYCKANDAYRVKWCLQWLATKSRIDNRFEIFDVENLIVKLYGHKLGEEPSRASVSRSLEAVYWDYASNTRCKWHEESDMWCCALASCKKIAYCMSKALLSVYGIAITPAHLPSFDNGPGNPKVVILDTVRFQKQANRDHINSTERSGPSGNLHDRTTLEPRGLQPFNCPVGRGRGILRLLDSINALQSDNN